jgi:hypothetical protein
VTRGNTYLLLVTLLAIVVPAAEIFVDIVLSNQRSLTVIAGSDVPVFDLIDEQKQIGALRRGSSVHVVQCIDRKSTFDFVIALDDKTIGRIGDGEWKLRAEPTGFFSRPQLLECTGI